MTDPVAFGLSALYVASLLVMAVVLRRRELLGRRAVRAVVHVAVAAWMVPTALLFESAAWAALLPALFAGINLACWLTGRLRSFSEPGEQSLGIVFHPVGICVLILLFWSEGERPIAVASVLVMGWADPLAALVGRAVRTPTFRPFDEQKSLAGSTAMLLAAGYSTAVFAGGVLVSRLLASLGLASVKSASPRTGKVIGYLERFIGLTLVLVGEWSALGLLLAAKSIARFRELEDRAFGEYYLIGTLASLGFAMVVGLIVRRLMS